MPFVDRNDKVQALASDAPDHSFRMAILPRASGRDPNLIHAHTFDLVIERVFLDSVSVSNQVAPRRAPVPKALNQDIDHIAVQAHDDLINRRAYRALNLIDYRRIVS